MTDWHNWSHDPVRCREIIYVADTYRRTGRGKTGFEMHYIRRQCGRKPGANGYCWQHAHHGEQEHAATEERE
jgi:hypothetical protein